VSVRSRVRQALPGRRPVGPLVDEAGRDTRSARERFGLPAAGLLVMVLGEPEVEELRVLWSALGGGAAVVPCADPVRAEAIRAAARANGASAHPVAAGDDLAGLLCAADVGLVLTAPPERLLPQELFACLDVRLPFAAAGNRAVRRFAKKWGVGRVFDEGDSESLGEALRRAAGITRGFAAVAADYRLDWETCWPTPDSRPVRLGMGTANSAGQLAQLARAVTRARQDVGAEVVMTDPGAVLRYPADVHLDPKRQADLDVQLDQARRVLGSYTHLIADGSRAMLGWMNGTDLAGDLPALRRAKVKVALLAHGSEVRDPDRHLREYEHSHYRHAPADVLETLRRKSSRNRKAAVESGLPLFVTTPDLLDDLPGATWLPLTVDADHWYCDRPVFERPRPVVVHAPSKRWTKGSADIVPVLEDLDRVGLIEFRMVEGVPSHRMREFVHEADLVVEQIGIGAYSAFACEAMAAGKPVLARLDPRNVERMGTEPPVVDITPGSLRERVEELVEDREAARRLGFASLRYARRVHDGRLAAEVLSGFLT
jgi:hypothetical protein